MFDLTILFPCRDPHFGFLAKAIESVFRQTTPRWRLLIIEEPSNRPETSEVLRGYATDPRVRIIVNTSKPFVGSLNEGMRAAETEFVSVLFDDDMLAPKAIEAFLAAIEASPGTTFFYGSRQFVDEEGQPVSSVYPSRARFTLEDFPDGSPVKHPMCWRVADALSIGGMDENLGPHGADDFDFPWCMAEAGFRFQAVGECLYLIRDHRAAPRLTTHVPLCVQIAELRKILSKHGLREAEIEAGLESRRRRYLQQALFLDEEDRITKERDGFDPRSGWRMQYQ